MNTRIEKLRKQSLTAINKLSPERALLITQFYKQTDRQDIPIPVRRAMSFKFLLENKTICINEGELIVGERGPAPKETSTYPEINLHSLDDLDVLNTRSKVGFKVDDQTRSAYETIIIPYWKGKTQREKIFESVPKEWEDSYLAGVFTEFQEQRAPGHTAAGRKIFKKGLLDLKEDIAASLEKYRTVGTSESKAKIDELDGMNIVIT